MHVVHLSLLAAAPLVFLPALPTAKDTVAAQLRPVRAPSHIARPVGLGTTLTTADGGQIYGFDINQSGNDGVLASAQPVGPSGVLVSMETFNEADGTITKVFAQSRGTRDSYAVHGISAGDVALVTHFIQSKNQNGAYRVYDVMNPVTAEKFTGEWTPPIKDIDVVMNAENQATSTSVLLAIELKNRDQPDLVVSNIAANTFSNIIHLDPNVFNGSNIPRLAQYTAANQAVIALSPDAGRAGGAAPINVLVDLKTSGQVRFTGYNNGLYGAGTVHGLAVDPNTGVAATATELNAQVEFYDLAKHTGIAAVQLPCSGNTDQLLSGAGVTVDPLNKLFLVAEPYYCGFSEGSAVVVYDERGKVIETIGGFTLPNGNIAFAVNEPPVAINPAKRMGWALIGPNFNQLQQFFY